MASRNGWRRAKGQIGNCTRVAKESYRATQMLFPVPSTSAGHVVCPMSCSISAHSEQIFAWQVDDSSSALHLQLVTVFFVFWLVLPNQLSPLYFPLTSWKRGSFLSAFSQIRSHLENIWLWYFRIYWDFNMPLI